MIIISAYSACTTNVYEKLGMNMLICKTENKGRAHSHTKLFMHCVLSQKLQYIMQTNNEPYAYHSQKLGTVVQCMASLCRPISYDTSQVYCWGCLALFKIDYVEQFSTLTYRWCLVLTQRYSIPKQQYCDPGGHW